MNPERTPDSAAGDRMVLAGFFAFLALLVLYRFWYLAHLDLTLYVDEAYYWVWSKNLDWGYFSKPPVIAALIAATTSVCGDGEVCVRLGSQLIQPVTALLILALGRRLFGTVAGCWAAALFLAMPAAFVSSVIISTDVPLLLFWAASLYAFWRALETGGTGWWLIAATALGLGLMSKYTMVLFGLFALVYLLVSPEHRGWWRDWRPWAAGALALLLFAPNLWWNWRHGFPTFVHTADISHLDRGTLHPDELAAFFFSQFAVFGPLPFAVLTWLALRPTRLWRDPRYRYLLLFSLPFLIVICLQALLGRAHANWAAPTYVGASILVAAWLRARGRRRLLAAALGLNLALGLAVFHLEGVAGSFGMELSRRTDPYLRLRGWRAFAHGVQQAAGPDPAVVFVSGSRTVLAHLAYQLRLPAARLAAWNPSGKVLSQFDISHPVSRLAGGDLLFVSEHPRRAAEFAGDFVSVGPGETLEIPVTPYLSRRYWLYRLGAFTGGH